MKITIDLQSILSTTRTSTSKNISAGSSVSTDVLNTSGFATNDLVLVGNLGDQKTELQKISSVTDANTVVLLAAAVDHPANTLIQKVFYDQVKVESSSDNTSFSLLATVTIKGNQLYAEYLDTIGTSSTYYKYRFYNSVTGTYSQYSNSFSGSEPSAIDMILQGVKDEMGADYDEKITNRMLFTFLADVDVMIGRRIVSTNSDYFKGTSNINLVSGTSEYVIPSTAVKVTRVLVKYTSSETQQESRILPYNYGNNTEDFSTSTPFHSIFQKASDKRSYIKLWRSPSENVTSGMSLDLITQPTRIFSMTDTLNTPFPLLHIDTLKAGVLEKVYRTVKDNSKRADDYLSVRERGIADILAITNHMDTSDSATTVSSDLMYALS